MPANPYSEPFAAVLEWQDSLRSGDPERNRAAYDRYVTAYAPVKQRSLISEFRERSKEAGGPEASLEAITQEMYSWKLTTMMKSLDPEIQSRAYTYTYVDYLRDQTKGATRKHPYVALVEAQAEFDTATQDMAKKKEKVGDVSSEQLKALIDGRTLMATAADDIKKRLSVLPPGAADRVDLENRLDLATAYQESLVLAAGEFDAKNSRKVSHPQSAVRAAFGRALGDQNVFAFSRNFTIPGLAAPTVGKTVLEKMFVPQDTTPMVPIARSTDGKVTQQSTFGKAVVYGAPEQRRFALKEALTSVGANNLAALVGEENDLRVVETRLRTATDNLQKLLGDQNLQMSLRAFVSGVSVANVRAWQRKEKEREILGPNAGLLTLSMDQSRGVRALQHAEDSAYRQRKDAEDRAAREREFGVTTALRDRRQTGAEERAKAEQAARTRQLNQRDVGLAMRIKTAANAAQIDSASAEKLLKALELTP